MPAVAPAAGGNDMLIERDPRRPASLPRSWQAIAAAGIVAAACLLAGWMMADAWIHPPRPASAGTPSARPLPADGADR